MAEAKSDWEDVITIRVVGNRVNTIASPTQRIKMLAVNHPYIESDGRETAQERTYPNHPYRARRERKRYGRSDRVHEAHDTEGDTEYLHCRVLSSKFLLVSHRRFRRSARAYWPYLSTYLATSYHPGRREWGPQPLSGLRRLPGSPSSSISVSGSAFRVEGAKYWRDSRRVVARVIDLEATGLITDYARRELFKCGLSKG